MEFCGLRYSKGGDDDDDYTLPLNCDMKYDSDSQCEGAVGR
jgi:hypothetical protein